MPYVGLLCVDVSGVGDTRTLSTINDLYPLDILKEKQSRQAPHSDAVAYLVTALAGLDVDDFTHGNLTR